MVGPGEVDGDLEGETFEECGKYGKVIKCLIFEVCGKYEKGIKFLIFEVFMFKISFKLVARKLELNRLQFFQNVQSTLRKLKQIFALRT